MELSVEADPECLLSEAGDMTWFRFTVKNTLDVDYDLQEVYLQGDLLGEPQLVVDSITISANDVMGFTLENVRIEEFEFDMDLSFQLAWKTTDYAPEDVDHVYPVVTEHIVAAPIRIERFVEPVMTVSCTPETLLAREGDVVTLNYTLRNDTKFDMNNITLQDAGLPQLLIPLDRNTLFAGEQMTATATFQMGTSALELYPTVQYTVRGVESKSVAEGTVTVEYVEVDLRMEVEKYPATSEGTLFRITLMNNGSHPMTDIRLTDEIGTLIADGLTLQAGAERTVSCTVPSAASSGSVRYISFEASGFDCLGGMYTVKSPSAYELLPFVESDQVRLRLTVSMVSSAQNEDGSNRLKVLFEIQNESQVPIRNAVVTESDYFKGVVNEYEALSMGTTSFEKEFVVPEGTRSLTFVLTAMDPAQTQYASIPMSIDLTPLMAPKPTSQPAIKPGKTVDVTGTIYDTERYYKIIRLSALIVFAVTLMFLLLSVIFHVAELNIRRWLPKEPVVRPFGPRKTPTGPIHVQEAGDPIHDQFGYLQPAKLRYMDRTDRLPVVGQEEGAITPVVAVTAPIPVSSRTEPIVSQPTPAAPRREGDITAVPIHKHRERPVMMSSDDTMPFAPVHEEQIEEILKAEVPKTAVEEPPIITPRVIEVKPSPRIVPKQKLEIVHVLPL